MQPTPHALDHPWRTLSLLYLSRWFLCRQLVSFRTLLVFVSPLPPPSLSLFTELSGHVGAVEIQDTAKYTPDAALFSSPAFCPANDAVQSA